MTEAIKDAPKSDIPDLPAHLKSRDPDITVEYFEAEMNRVSVNWSEREEYLVKLRDMASLDPRNVQFEGPEYTELDKIKKTFEFKVLALKIGKTSFVEIIKSLTWISNLGHNGNSYTVSNWGAGIPNKFEEILIKYAEVLLMQKLIALKDIRPINREAVPSLAPLVEWIISAQ